MWGLPILSVRGIPLRSRVRFRVSFLLHLLLSRLGFSYSRFGAAYAATIVVIVRLVLIYLVEHLASIVFLFILVSYSSSDFFLS